MKKRKLVILIFVTLLILISPFMIGKVKKILNDYKLTSAMDYIEIPSTQSKIYIKSITAIEPAIWKGSYEGILHYTDGSTAEIEISCYGDFFGIKGEDRGLFFTGQAPHQLAGQACLEVPGAATGIENARHYAQYHELRW